MKLISFTMIMFWIDYTNQINLNLKNMQIIRLEWKRQCLTIDISEDSNRIVHSTLKYFREHETARTRQKNYHVWRTQIFEKVHFSHFRTTLNLSMRKLCPLKLFLLLPLHSIQILYISIGTLISTQYSSLFIQYSSS